MKTSIDVKIEEYNLELLEEEYDRISIFIEDAKKLKEEKRNSSSKKSFNVS